jgi:hypothetical protein
VEAEVSGQRGQSHLRATQAYALQRCEFADGRQRSGERVIAAVCDGAIGKRRVACGKRRGAERAVRSEAAVVTVATQLVHTEGCAHTHTLHWRRVTPMADVPELQ